MKLLCCHPRGLMYTEIFLRLEPLSLELVAAAARAAGHEVRLLDLQLFGHADFFALLDGWQPDAVGFSLNYLANLPEVVDLAKGVRHRLPSPLVFVGGHSASSTAAELLEHAEGAFDCVVRGEGEEVTPRLLEAWAEDRRRLHALPGVLTADGQGPPPGSWTPGIATGPAGIFCRNDTGISSVSWTRPPRSSSPAAAPGTASSAAPGPSTGAATGRRAPRSQRRNWPRSGSQASSSRTTWPSSRPGMAWPSPARSSGGTSRRSTTSKPGGMCCSRTARFSPSGSGWACATCSSGSRPSTRRGSSVTASGSACPRISRRWRCPAPSVSRSPNIVADPGWDCRHFQVIREWARSIPEIVSVSVNTPYPGTETFLTEARNFTTRDYRLFDIQHAVLPTALPLAEFYRELVSAQQALNTIHLGFAALRKTAGVAARLLARGQTNFVRMLWKFNSVSHPDRQLADHARPVRYDMRIPAASASGTPSFEDLYVLQPAPGARAETPEAQQPSLDARVGQFLESQE